MTKKVAIILSGAGVFDGSELHETVLTMLALERNSISYTTFAPDIPQAHVVNHANGEAETSDIRNVLVESNRLSRGTTQPLSELSYRDFDALVLVGGFGAAKNLSDFAFEGSDYTVEPAISEVINSFHSEQRWILAMCIAPVLLAKSIENVTLTVGSDVSTINALSNAGAHHHNCTATEHCVDEINRIITTPAYMLAINLLELEEGINSAIATLMSRIR